MKGKPNKFLLEPLNFADDVVRGSNCQKRAVLKNWSDALFINLDNSGWARSPFLFASSFSRWYLVLQQSRKSSKCFLKVVLESKVIPRNFT